MRRRRCRDFAGHVTASPERLGEIEDRLAALERLKRKYGAGAGTTGLAQVIAFGEEVKGKLEELENREARLEELEAELAKAAKDYREAAKRLSEQRAAAGKKLAKLAEKQINELAMNAKFAVDVAAEEERGELERELGGTGWRRRLRRIRASR